MTTPMTRLHCGVPVPSNDAPAEAWAAFHAQVERNLEWVARILADKGVSP